MSAYHCIDSESSTGASVTYFK